MTENKKKGYRVAKRKGITEEQAKQLETWYEDYNRLLRGMYHDPLWVETFGLSKRVRILSLCLFYQFITTQQVLMLQLTPGGIYETANTYLYRLVTDKKYLVRQKVPTTQTDTETVYTLTNAGLNYCVGKLKEWMETARTKELPYAVADACIEAIKDRFLKMRERKNNGHFLGILDMNAYFLSPSCRSPYTFQIEMGIEESGRITPFYERLLYSVERDNGSFQCDALYQSTYQNDIPCNLYIELDTGTQREKLLSNKIEHYASTVFPLWEKGVKRSRTHFLLFAVQTHTAHLSKRSLNKELKKSESLSSVGLHYLRIAVLYAKTQLYAEGKSMESLPDYPLEHIISFLDATDSKNMPAAIANDFNDFFCTTNTYYKEVLADIPGATIEDLIDTVHMQTNTRKEVLQNFNEARHKEAYRNRRTTIFSAATTSQLTYDACLKGFSIFTLPSRNPDEVSPFLAPNLFGEIGTHLSYLLPFLGYLPNSKVPYTYEPVTDTFLMHGYVLRNHFTYTAPTGTVHVYVENVSDDVGGYIRMQRYLQSISWSNENGVLLCLTSEDFTEKLKKVWKDSLYAQNIYSDIHISLPLDVIFITYDQFVTHRGAFIFDDYLDVHVLAMGEKAGLIHRNTN